MKIIYFISILLLPLNIFFVSNCYSLEIVYPDHSLPIITFKGRPLFAFGPSPQNVLTYLPKGRGNDIADWVNWASKHGFKHVRSYPPSIKVSEPSQNLFKYSIDEPQKFDLRNFNPRYFDELRKACQLLKQQGIIVHMQLWQSVYWKKSWTDCYYNPQNNVNPDISKHAGPGEFVTTNNPILLQHQKNYVHMILDATGDLDNVFYDIMNEIGNGTGTSEKWVLEIVRAINDWEHKNNKDLLVTLNDEGGKRMGGFSLNCPQLDLIIKDLGRYDEHIDAKTSYKKPTISVRNIDYDYDKNKRFYFYGKNNLEVNTNGDLQTRGRKYWWRMFFAGVQIAGGYSDAVPAKDFRWYSNRLSRKFGIPEPFSLNYKMSYRFNELSERYFTYFINFIDKVQDYENMIPAEDVLIGHPVKNSYILQSNQQAVIYLESPNGKAGFDYKKSKAKLTSLLLKDGRYNCFFYFPYKDKMDKYSITVEKGRANIFIPSFKDDMAILLRNAKY